MKVLIVVEHGSKQRFLVTLHTEELVKEIKNLISWRKHSRAIATALCKGRFERVVQDHELPTVKADLILSENSTSWDLTK